MNSSDSISLRFSDSVSTPVRSRISYAFRVFAAIYNYSVGEDQSGERGFCCFYGEARDISSDPRILHIPARYRLGSPGQPIQALTRCKYGGEDFYLALGLDPNGRPDWLGEIFEWLSSSYETSATQRDSVGRIPYADSVFHHHSVPHRKPHATLLMAWLENSLRNGLSKEALPRAPSPDPAFEHLVVSTHDIDFYCVDNRTTLIRLLKNLVVACHPYRSSSFLLDNAAFLVRQLAGKRVGDYLPSLTDSIADRGFRSSFFVVPRRADRRDPNYEIAQIVPRLHDALRKGFPIALHGSYRSIVEDSSLRLEAVLIERAIGKRPLGSRQHWLRFDSHEKLFEQVERSGLVFDSSLGFTDKVGFRNGASFAFPPYDFKQEKPHAFLEIPLVLMDGGLEAEARELEANAKELAEEVLRESRRWGWGGVSILWHNPMEALSVPSEINSVFWKCANERTKFREAWLSGDQFLRCSLARYQCAGLLENVALDR